MSTRRVNAEAEQLALLAEVDKLRLRVAELVAQRDDALVELVTGQAPPETLSPWERAVAGLNALVDADVIFHVEPDGHISAPFSDEHIEWDLRARRWALTHDDEDEGMAPLPHPAPCRVPASPDCTCPPSSGELAEQRHLVDPLDHVLEHLADERPGVSS